MKKEFTIAMIVLGLLIGLNFMFPAGSRTNMTFWGPENTAECVDAVMKDQPGEMRRYVVDYCYVRHVTEDLQGKNYRMVECLVDEMEDNIPEILDIAVAVCSKRARLNVMDPYVFARAECLLDYMDGEDDPREIMNGRRECQDAEPPSF